MRATLPVRQQDNHGAGYFGAPRGDRSHNGIDFACYPETEIHPFAEGTVTKLGYPYGDDLSYRYVEVTDDDGNQHRYFYVEPMVEEGDRVSLNAVLGTVQDLDRRYPGITMHCHYEVKRDGEYLNPENFAGL